MAHMRLGPTRSASLPSGTAKKNDTTPAMVRPRPTWAALRPDDLGEEDRAPGEERALADREQHRLHRQLASQRRRWQEPVEARRARGSITSTRALRVRVAWICAPGWRPGGARAARSWRPPAPPARPSACCSRAAPCSPRWRDRAPPRWRRAAGCSRLPPSYVAGIQVVCRSLVAGHEPVGPTTPWPDGDRVVHLARADPAAPDARRPRRPRGAAPRPHRAARRRPDRPDAARPRRGGRRARGGDVRLGRDRRRLRLRRACRSTASPSRSTPTGGSGSADRRSSTATRATPS